MTSALRRRLKMDGGLRETTCASTAWSRMQKTSEVKVLLRGKRETVQEWTTIFPTTGRTSKRVVGYVKRLLALSNCPIAREINGKGRRMAEHEIIHRETWRSSCHHGMTVMLAQDLNRFPSQMLETA